MLPNRSFPFIMNFNHDLPTMQVQVGNSIVPWIITLQSSIIINHHHRRHHVGLAFRLCLACSVSPSAFSLPARAIVALGVLAVQTFMMMMMMMMPCQ